jgi:hypothetical protein
MKDLSPVFSEIRAYYKMDRGYGNKLYDRLNQTVHGELYGGMNWVESSLVKKF